MMRRLTGMLTTLGSLSLGMWTLGLPAELVAAPLVITPADLPELEKADSRSAADLAGVEERQTLDYQLIFLPAGSGGERPADGSAPELASSYLVTGVAPLENSLSISTGTLPEYAIVRPNRSIETQTDPQRLTLVAPDSED